MPLVDPTFYLLAFVALTIVGISKGGFGGGLGVLNVPLMSVVINPFQAAAIALPVLCVMDLYGVYAYRRQWNRNLLGLAVAGASVGIVLGAITFRFFSVDHLRLLIGCIALVFALEFWFVRNRSRTDTSNAKIDSNRTLPGLFWSSISGFTTTTAHAGGPPLDAWLLRLNLEKTEYQATTVAYYAIVNYLKLIPYALLGQFTVSNLATSAVLLPVALLAMMLGIRLHHKIPVERFYQVCYALLLVIGIRLIYDGLT